MAILEVKNIHKSFGKTEVLKGVSFSMEHTRSRVGVSCCIRLIRKR